jgi:hypothetical protein
MCVDCVLTSPRIAQVDPGDEPLPEVVLSHNGHHSQAIQNTLDNLGTTHLTSLYEVHHSRTDDTYVH